MRSLVQDGCQAVEQEVPGLGVERTLVVTVVGITVAARGSILASLVVPTRQVDVLVSVH